MEHQTIGLRGIEVFHTEHAPSDNAEFAELARRFDLIPTGGSDFHGSNKPGIELGAGKIPYTVLENMRKRTLV